MRRSVLYMVSLAALMWLAVSCANIGNPSGGPRDEDPPRFIAANPGQGAVEVSPSRAVLTFSELVALKDAFTKVVVSPPQSQMARVSSLGRRVIVDFNDTLRSNTTYTIDFGDAIADNNEGNKLENFIYTFSTGPVLDSLMVSGMVLGAEDLEPAKGIYVGLHSNLADSAFKKQRFDRLAKTDEYGRFVIGGLPAGKYRIYALEDRDGDMAWSSPEETLAFYDAIIEPYAERIETTDTIFDLKTGEVDTVVNRERTRFLPNNILLRSYNTGYKQQYITKYERVDSTRFNFLLNAASDSVPRIEVLAEGRAPVVIDEVAVKETSATNDTITYWLTDRELISADTLRVAMRYYRADSLYNPVAVTDTLRLLTQRPRVKPSKAKDKVKKAKADSVPPPVPTLELKPYTARLEVNGVYMIEFPEPLAAFDKGKVKLQMKEDTLMVAAPGFGEANLRFDSLNPRLLIVDYPWAYETKYQISVDSLAGKGIYGLDTAPFSQELNTRKESDYSELQLNLKGIADSIPLYVDILDAGGKVTRRGKVAGNSVKFEFMLPGKYTPRVVVDLNGNGKWDPGNFEQGVQPDVAYYYPQPIELKQNWSQELDWDVFATPVDRMKPDPTRGKK